MRKFLICILTIALMLTMCSCGTGSKTDDTQAAPNTTAPAAQTKGLEFQSNGDGTCTLTGIGEFSGEKLTIPAESPDGDTVTAIAENALALSEENSYDACMSLETLIFDHVDLTLDSYAVWGLSNLKQMIVKDSTITLDANAMDCEAIETMQVENSTLTVGQFAIASESFTGKNSTLTFEESAFSPDTIQKLVLTDCDTTIGKDVFFYSEQLTTLTVQGGTLEIGEGAFTNCTGLTEITLNCPVSVGKSAFDGCENLISVQFGDETVKLGDEAFSYCSQLESVSVGDADVEFGTDVFYACPETLVVSLNGREFNRDLEENIPVVENVYTVGDLSITLSDGFKEFEVEGAEYALMSDTVGVVVFKELFSVFTQVDPNELTLEQYAQALIIANEFGDIEVREKDGITYFLHEGDNGFTYYTCVLRGTDAFWRINFYTYTEHFEEMLPQFAQWASGVTFG